MYYAYFSYSIFFSLFCFLIFYLSLIVMCTASLNFLYERLSENEKLLLLYFNNSLRTSMVFLEEEA